jgi:hypothetical protein
MVLNYLRFNFPGTVSRIKYIPTHLNISPFQACFCSTEVLTSRQKNKIMHSIYFVRSWSKSQARNSWYIMYATLLHSSRHFQFYLPYFALSLFFSILFFFYSSSSPLNYSTSQQLGLKISDMFEECSFRDTACTHKM